MKNFEWIFGGTSNQNSNEIAYKFVYFFDAVFMTFLGAILMDFGRFETPSERPGSDPAGGAHPTVAMGIPQKSQKNADSENYH